MNISKVYNDSDIVNNEVKSRKGGLIFPNRGVVEYKSPIQDAFRKHHVN